MTKPVTIPNTFATATTAIPLSNLDADFSTVATALNDANTYSNYAPDTGSANAYVVTLSGVSTTYSAGLRIQFKAGNANTTASTLNVNGGGAKNITYQDATAIASGTIAANSIVDVMYDGTQFLLMNDPAGATGGDVVGPSSATDNAIVRFDGTTGKLVQNSVVTIADSTGDISGVGQLNATTLDATNIEVANIKAKDGTAAGSIADSTGVVSFTANPVMSGGTANGVLYLDGSKVATSGSALTFDGSTLTETNATSAANLVLNNTVSGKQTYINLNSGATVLNSVYRPATTNDFQFDANYGSIVWGIGSAGTATEQMRLTSTGLGIGTSSNTDSKLYVKGNLSAVYGLKLESTAGAAKSYGFYITSDALTIRDVGVGADRLTLDSSGNLGLGVTPSAWGSGKGFEVGFNGNALWSFSQTDSYVTNNARFTDAWRYVSTAAASAYRQSGGQHIWNIAASGTAGNTISFTQAMTLDASGNLGVGTTSPGARLSLSTTGAGAQTVMTLNNAQAVAANVGASID